MQMVAHTPMGRAISSVVMLAGILVLALPVTILGAHFSLFYAEEFTKDDDRESDADSDFFRDDLTDLYELEEENTGEYERLYDPWYKERAPGERVPGENAMLREQFGLEEGGSFEEVGGGRNGNGNNGNMGGGPQSPKRGAASLKSPRLRALLRMRSGRSVMTANGGVVDGGVGVGLSRPEQSTDRNVTHGSRGGFGQDDDDEEFSEDDGDSSSDAEERKRADRVNFGRGGGGNKRGVGAADDVSLGPRNHYSMRQGGMVAAPADEPATTITRMTDDDHQIRGVPGVDGEMESEATSRQRNRESASITPSNHTHLTGESAGATQSIDGSSHHTNSERRVVPLRGSQAAPVSVAAPPSDRHRDRDRDRDHSHLQNQSKSGGVPPPHSVALSGVTGPMLSSEDQSRVSSNAPPLPPIKPDNNFIQLPGYQPSNTTISSPQSAIPPPPQLFSPYSKQHHPPAPHLRNWKPSSSSSQSATSPLIPPHLRHTARQNSDGTVNTILPRDFNPASPEGAQSAPAGDSQFRNSHSPTTDDAAILRARLDTHQKLLETLLEKLDGLSSPPKH